MEALMNAVAFVFQDTHIFAESVYNNIAMHRKVHREDVEKAAKAARCHDFILSFPNGYDTKLGDGGHIYVSCSSFSVHHRLSTI